MPGISGLLVAASLCACTEDPAGRAATGVISGSVAYRERVALPPDAVVLVKLVDAASPEDAAGVIAETTVRAEGRQVPLPFELRYDTTRVSAERSYGVRAAILAAGRTVFASEGVHPVSLAGARDPLELQLRAVREGAGRGSPPGLQGSAWRLEDLGGTPAAAGVEATLEFPEPGRLSGNGSCNRFFADVELAGEAISLGPVGSTRMACVEPAATQEARYLETLQKARRITVEGATLLIYFDGAELPLRFVRLAEASPPPE